jgi:hypothetical protein
MAQTALAEFQALALQDDDLQHDLRGRLDREDFVTRVLERARERGLAVERAEVEAALNASMQSWLMRWLDR